MTRNGRKLEGRAVRAAAALTLAGVTAVVAASGAQAASCTPTDPKVETAFQVRALQTELMVAALSCRARGDYNSFVRKFEAPLVANGKNLRAYFRETFAGNGDRRLDSYITRIANQASSKRISMGADYCDQAMASFQKVLTMEADELEAYARSRAGEQERETLRCAESLEEMAGLE